MTAPLQHELMENALLAKLMDEDSDPPRPTLEAAIRLSFRRDVFWAHILIQS
jgi:hypothetical protein